ncbi:unnamed protein product [Ectocarpus sp. CCAP 1310/34]|nr:unnamed protein product [Ectocarpus sp. CCAP 1310/34]
MLLLVVAGVHTRLVLLWQNNAEADRYCTDEPTAVQVSVDRRRATLTAICMAKVNGLLEVTALISGDVTRCNIPGNTFRRAIARLMSKGATAGLVSGRAREQAAAALPANLPHLRSVGELSRVSERDPTHTRWSKRPHSLGLFTSGVSRDLGAGAVAKTLVAKTISVTMFRGPRATPPPTRVKLGGTVSKDMAAAAAAAGTAEGYLFE